MKRKQSAIAGIGLLILSLFSLQVHAQTVLAKIKRTKILTVGAIKYDQVY